MKKKNLISIFAATLVVGLGITAYAAAPSNSYCQGNGYGLGRITGFRGYDIITNVLKGKGVTETEVTNALNSGKTLNSLAEEKGITADELKKSLLNEKTKIIDDAVAKGTLTKVQGEEAKTTITENISNCTTPGQMTGRMGGFNGGRGMQCGRCLNTSNPSK